MTVEATQHDEEVQDVILENDPRWLLVQRILDSGGFQRAGQLRKILLYVSRSAILNPDRILREYEIACDVLERRHDFDPANDNIVRAQFTHLRRKLENYFATEGKRESLTLILPKGSYRPTFATVQVPASSDPAGAYQLDIHGNLPRNMKLPSDPSVHKTLLRVVSRTTIAILCLVATVVFTLYAESRYFPRAKGDRVTYLNPFIQFLARPGGNISVVLPDTSEMFVGLISGIRVSPTDYANSDYALKQLDAIKDPALRQALALLSTRRNTTVNEAVSAFDLMEALDRAGAHSTLRYARDLHVRNLNEDNSILIGSRDSDPWVALFTDKTNFRYVHDNGDYYFENIAPQPGELARYYGSFGSRRQEAASYADVAFMENPSQSGYVLLIIGSDTESSEAAAQFLLHARLPSDITAILTHKDLRSFELLLRGKHITGEANDSFELVAFRYR